MPIPQFCYARRPKVQSTELEAIGDDMRLTLLPFSLVFLPLGACGTAVPQIEEPLEYKTGEKTLELKIKEKVFCELQTAVINLNHDKSRYIYADTTPIKPVPESWGVTMTLTLTILEDSSLNPGVALNNSLIPGAAYGAAMAQSFSLGLGGTFSSDATRVDKFTFYYPIKDLEVDTGECANINNLHGTSFLLESQLGIERWLDNAADMRSDVGVSSSNKQQVLSYDVKFDVVSSGNATPTWKLVRVTTGTNGNFFSTKRERTHELLLTFGPTDPADKRKPGLLASNDNLASQVGSSVTTGVTNALSK